MGDADLDSNAAAGVELDNALAGNLFYSQDDAWVASSNPGVGLKITNWLNGKVRVGGGRIQNHASDAVLINDNTIDFRETDDSIIETNGGLPFAAKSPPVGIFYSGALSTTNGLTHAAFPQFGLRMSYATQVLQIVEFGVVSGSSTSPLVAVTAISGTGILIGSITYEID